MADTDHMKANRHKGVTLQQMVDCGLNAFAVQLLCESYSKHPKPEPVTFEFRGVQISIALVGGEEERL